MFSLNAFDVDSSFEKDEDYSNEGFLDKNLNKNEFNFFFFENLNDNNENGNEIKPMYYLKQTPDDNKTLTGNTGNTGNNSLSIEKAAKTTNEKNQTKFKKIPKNSEKIFLINKVNKKLGRIEKSKKNIKGKHNKWSQDNIIQKIKASFHEKIFCYINREYDKYLLTNHIDGPKLIRRISTAEVKKIKKDDNLLWLSLKLKDLFSKELSSKYTNFKKNYNIINIKKLYKENKAKNVINILERTVREMFYDFCNDTPIDGFETLKYDLESQKQKMEKDNEDNIEEYLKKYKDIAQDLEQIFILKKSRANRKNENLK